MNVLTLHFSLANASTSPGRNWIQNLLRDLILFYTSKIAVWGLTPNEQFQNMMICFRCLIFLAVYQQLGGHSWRDYDPENPETPWRRRWWFATWARGCHKLVQGAWKATWTWGDPSTKQTVIDRNFNCIIPCNSTVQFNHLIPCQGQSQHTDTLRTLFDGHPLKIAKIRPSQGLKSGAEVETRKLITVNRRETTNNHKGRAPQR